MVERSKTGSSPANTEVVSSIPDLKRCVRSDLIYRFPSVVDRGIFIGTSASPTKTNNRRSLFFLGC